MDRVRCGFVIGLLLGLLIGARAQEPVTLPARIVRQVWCVGGTIDGRTASFLVDTGADDTIVLPGTWKQAHEASIRLGRLEIRTTVRVMDLPVLRALAPEMKAPVVGILGMDVLRDIAVGFDTVSGTVSLWPRGRLSPAFCRSWIQRAPAWPGGKTPGARTLRLDLSMGHRMGVSSTVGGRPARLILDTGSTGATVIEEIARAAGAVTAYSEPLHALYASSQSKVQGVNLARVGVEARPWLFFRTQPASAYRGQPGSPQGVLGLVSLQSRRSLLDLPLRTVYLEDGGTDARLSLFLTELIELPVRVVGSGLRIGPVYPGPAASFLKPMEEQAVVSLSGMPSRRIVALLKSPSRGNLTALANLVKATRHSYAVVVQQPKGTYRFEVNR